MGISSQHQLCPGVHTEDLTLVHSPLPETRPLPLLGPPHQDKMLPSGLIAMLFTEHC